MAPVKRALLALLLAATPALAASPNDWLAGRWFGTGQPNDKSEMWLETAGADGSFHVQFRACRQGKAFDATNDGHWNIAGATETITIDTVNGAKGGTRQDIYIILSHTKDKQVYRYQATGFVYTSHKVDGAFTMPSCDLTS
jgi:hypothetical protein